ncbi:MAG: FeoB-associated Cys-rich membrane protein [Candidatus Bathyarchaeota archaeon]|nr:MAG: FeoB-associated Cys-rich membrane protein [Candidatus Bathyarchaeota archaeon]
MIDLPWPVMSVVIMAIGVLIGILVIWRMLRDRKSGFPAQDERTKKVTGKAASYAFLFGVYFMMALAAANLTNQEFGGSPFLDAGYALVISTLVQSLTFLGLRVYFNRKGEV